jgi:hypothetical protein
MSEAEVKKSISGFREASSGYSDRLSALQTASSRIAETDRSFTIPHDLATKLEEIASESGLSEGEILRTGIALVELAVTARKRNKKFGVVEQDTPLITEVVGL